MKNTEESTIQVQEGIKKRVPRIRFPEFRDAPEWEEKKGDQVFDQISNKQHNSDLPVLAITQEYGAIPRDMIDYQISVTDKSIESYKVVETGDFIISLRSFQGGIEYSAYKGICSPAYIILRKKQTVNDTFFKYFFKTENFIRLLNKNIEGIRDGKMVSFKQFSELLLPNPSISEQKKIADCLSSLDELIAAHTRKLDALKAYKEGLMQQLFPAEGETVPRLRFPKFWEAQEWEEKPLEKVFNIFQGFAFPSSDSVEKGVRWLKIADVSIQQMNHNAPSYLPIEHKEKFGKFIVKQGDYVIALTRPILNKQLKMASVDKVFHGSLLNQRVGKLISDQDITFVYYLLQTAELINAIEKSISGSEPPNLSTQEIEDIKTYIPSLPEQQKIASFLSSIDELIALQARKTEALKVHKKGLVQQLFPQVGQ